MIDSKIIYEFLGKITKGKVITYKALAAACGNPKAARAVGNILSKNPNVIKVPCHRVVRSDGKVGGYVLGTTKKIELLRKEGVEIKNGKVAERFIINSID
ncbi:MAG: MGMT family protein [DPANN group archaeon]|nr:MGMT family protein [DPANN group archaeon]